jgi:hypothetical protein
MVFCEVCKINTANMKSHCKSKKHINGGKRDAMSEEQLKEYHKKYYLEHNLKDKYKEKKKCECCDKMVAKYNWSKHIQTEKHFKKQHLFNNPEPEYVRDRLMKEDEIIDPLTVKEEDIELTSDEDSTDTEEVMKNIRECIINDSDSEDEIGEVMKEVMEIESLPPKKLIKKPTKK